MPHLLRRPPLRSAPGSAPLFRRPVYIVTNGIPPGTASVFAEINAQPVIGNLAELAEWDAFRTVHGWDGGAALHFDTGMNRLGLPPEEASALAARTKMPGHGVSLIMSHFACSDDPAHPLNAAQVQAMRDIRGLFRGIPASLANSSGIFLGAPAHFDLVRPGIALYGGNPTPDRDNPYAGRGRAEGAHRSTSRYRTWGECRLQRDMDREACDQALPSSRAGYADGYPRPAGASDAVSGGEAIFGGRRCPVVGRVSMDLLAVDVTDATDLHPRRGSFMTLIGGSIEIDQFAQWSRTISYDVLTRLGQRYRRVWVS